MYRYEATSLPGFVQQLAVSYVGHGYFFYVTGWIPGKKPPEAIDRKLIDRYGIAISKWARSRRKRAQEANVQYLRLGRFFVLLATHGSHSFFTEEAGAIRDIRRVPIKVGGYAVSYRGGHPHVRIANDEYNRLKSYLLDLSVRRSSETLAREFFRLPFEPYAPVRRQVLNLHRAVNRARKTAGYELLPMTCLRLRRKPCRPFEPLTPSLRWETFCLPPSEPVDGATRPELGFGVLGEAEAGTPGTEPAEE
jgi:hypothetical protein